MTRIQGPSDDQRARGILASALEQDAAAHEAGNYEQVGESYDDVLGELLPIQNVDESAFKIAFEFWDGWADSRNHQWLHYDGIGRDDWPRLARQVASALRTEAPIDDSRILEHFGRPRFSLVEWLRELLKGRAAPA